MTTGEWPIRQRFYKTAATRKAAEKRLGSRVESIECSSESGHSLWVYDLDEYGQPPAVICPECGREIDDE